MNTNPKRPPAVELGPDNFEAEVLKSQMPVLVAFCAPWSHPCHILEAVLEEVAVVCTGQVKVVRVNADDNPDLSMWYEIQSIPTLIYFIDGTPRAKVVGTVSKDAILSKMQSVSRGAHPESTDNQSSK